MAIYPNPAVARQAFNNAPGTTARIAYDNAPYSYDITALLKSQAQFIHDFQGTAPSALSNTQILAYQGRGGEIPTYTNHGQTTNNFNPTEVSRTHLENSHNYLAFIESTTNSANERAYDLILAGLQTPNIGGLELSNLNVGINSLDYTDFPAETPPFSPSPSQPPSTPQPVSPSSPPPISTDNAEEIIQAAKKIQDETKASLEEIKKATENLNNYLTSSQAREKEIWEQEKELLVNLTVKLIEKTEDLQVAKEKALEFINKYAEKQNSTN
ncbi:12933_t:CDS:2 [Entrophospora sp. SA101]|nr:15221_t:CDS:2 [Entrophospora sp. SA101]CAJ0747029.1 12933_t:CDS:2 [Entrophospora sp. SA101]CAJ0844866.1 3811_t:CDS:2 [Entrophospora sp. SA101]CAJ0897624.1 4221_t:CDS:2 [Entrophospora sp. SA101]